MSRTLPDELLELITAHRDAAFSGTKHARAGARAALESAILAALSEAREGALREAEPMRRALLDLFEAAGNESDGEFNGDRLDALRDAVLAAAPFVVPRPEPEPLTKADVLAALKRGERDADDAQKALDATFGPEGEP